MDNVDASPEKIDFFVYNIMEWGKKDKDGRHYFAKQGDKIVELDRDSAKEMLRDQPNDEVPDELDIPF